jgi:HAD superfamily hydrolase (TIGR01484 family)
MKPVQALPPRVCRNLDALFSDLDDTLTEAGKITAGAYDSMWKLRRSGLDLVIVTGRPSGWADAILRLMPVRHVMTENGAVILSHDLERRTVIRRYELDEKERRKNKKILERVSRKILRKAPGLRLAADQVFRETDLAFDICEDREPLDQAALAGLEAMIRAEGLTYKISSIHVNAWVGSYTKAAACRKLLGRMRRQAGRPLRSLFIGDSPNDEPLFAAFDLSVGVSNIRAFESRMKTLPAYVTRRPGASGFSEMARHILAHR